VQHFGQLILRKISKTFATRCHILRLKCTNSISAGAPVHPTPLQHSPDPVARFQRAYTSKRREKKEQRRKRKREGREERGKGCRKKEKNGKRIRH